MEILGLSLLGLLIFFFLFVWALAGIKIVRPYEKGIVERLGKYNSELLTGNELV